jgi:MYXO-CTERM domain-containing protein
VLFLLAANLSAGTVGFAGPYAPGFWTVQNVQADGYVLSLAPSAMVLLGGDDAGQGHAPGSTVMTAVAPFNGVVLFSWVYQSADLPLNDSAGWVVEGVLTTLANASGGSGDVSFPVTAGQTFGFWVATVNNAGGRGTLSIGNFSGPDETDIPEPATWCAAALGLVGVVLVRRRRR